MMSDWNIGTISEVCSLVTDGSHFSPKSCENGEYMVSVKDFKGFGFDFANCKRISNDDYDKLKSSGCIPEIGDILIGKDGARFFEDIIIYNQPEKPALLSSIAILRCNIDIILPHFLYYICQNPLFKKDVRDNYGSGSAIPRIVLKDFKRMPIAYPNIEEQRRIVATLIAIDDKIALNTAINENLEKQAQAIYDQMFIENADESWKTGILSDLAVITMGQSPKGDTFNETGKGAVFYQGRTDFGFRFPTRRLYTTEPKRMALCGDSLISVRAPVGDLNVAYENCCIGRGLASIRSKDNHQSYVLYTLFTLKNQLDVFNGEGTVFGSINKDALNSIEITISPIELMDRFESIANSIDKAICNNYEEICRLQAIRDSLLPKLMNGEIDVSNVKI